MKLYAHLHAFIWVLLLLSGPLWGAEPHATNASDDVPSVDELQRYQPYSVNLSGYKPMYFLAGTNPKDTAYQISFKYRIFNPDGPWARDLPPVKGLHFAYTQKAFWDLKSDSKPFEDTSYMPELMFQSGNLAGSWDRVDFLSFRTGLQHESNGKEDLESRSTNFIYFKPALMLHDADKELFLMLSPSLWGYLYNNNESNGDLDAYRGFFDWEMKLGVPDGLVLGSHLRWADAGPSFQIDVTYPLHRTLQQNMNVYLHAQYFDGWAETLVNYRDHTHAVRIGLSIVR